MTQRARVLGAWLYVALLVAVWATMRRGTDDSGLATVLAFGPRWVWGVPVLLCLPRPGRGVRLPAGLAALIVLGPIMGFVWAGAWSSRSVPAGRSVRLMTANLGSRLVVPSALFDLVHRLNPDVVVMQECTERAAEAFVERPWSYHDDDGLCFASRVPVEDAAIRYRQDTFGRGAFGARYRLRLGDVPIEIANLHLDSPRDGILALVRGTDGRAGLQAAITERRDQSRLVRQWLADADQQTVIVAGDFNVMEESAIYRESWGFLRNAFSTAGLGWGYTKRENWFLAARIDHVLTGPRWWARRAWVEAGIGSDHRPLVVDLVLTP